MHCRGPQALIRPVSLCSESRNVNVQFVWWTDSRAHWAGGEPAGTWPQPPPPPGVLVPAARSTVPRESRRGGLSVHRAEDTPDALPREVL